MSERLETGWLLGATRDGLVAVGPERVITVALDGAPSPRHRLVTALAAGDEEGAAAAAELLELAGAELGALRDTLREAGALVTSPQPAGELPAGARPLAEALLDPGEPHGAWFTADELLLIPAGVEPRLARRALHAFAGGLEPKARADAYAEVAASGSRDALAGDAPAADLAAAAQGLDPGRFHVVRAGGAAADPLTPGELDALDATRPHRLGAIQSVSAPARVKIAGAAPSIVRVRYASSNLRLPAVGWAHGAETDPEHAALVARAEGAERHAAGRTSAVELRRAEPHALDAEAIGSEAFWAPNDRQARALAAPPDGVPPLWAAARTATGERRWVPAAQVLLPFTDPQRPDPRPGATSSGVAAYTDEAGAAERGLLELVERDALMWHWIQQVTPRRLTEAPLPEPVRDQLAAVRAVGWEPFLLDLSLDTVPVVLALLRRGERLAIGLSAARRVEPAAAKALGEALMIGRLDVDEPLAPVADPAAVTTPEDHLALHHHPDHAHAHRFLLAGDEVDPRELAAPDEPLAELVRPIGEPLFVRFDAPAVRPFVVVRALVPGIVPITFGHDLEPLGLRRAAAPIRTRDGRTLGGELDLRETGPLLPHPFP